MIGRGGGGGSKECLLLWFPFLIFDYIGWLCDGLFIYFHFFLLLHLLSFLFAVASAYIYAFMFFLYWFNLVSLTATLAEVGHFCSGADSGLHWSFVEMGFRLFLEHPESKWRAACGLGLCGVR